MTAREKTLEALAEFGFAWTWQDAATFEAKEADLLAAIDAEVEKARAEARERCALVAWNHECVAECNGDGMPGLYCQQVIAAAIREIES